MNPILFCTVGGSHAPIVRAIESLRPAHTVFFCTGRDPATGRPGSLTQVTGEGLVIKADSCDPNPTLPNIPTLTHLGKDGFSVVIVPADDLDGAASLMAEKLAEWAKRAPAARRVADYTGGTKTMSAALVTAALPAEGVELQVVTGARINLVKVSDGTEAVCGVALEGLRFGRAFEAALAPWQRHAYDESVLVLDRIGAPRAPALRARWQRARDLSAAFSAWDRFDHAEARRLLEPYSAAIGRVLPEHFAALGVLTGPHAPAREAARLLDLARNAERRAIQGRYDDAVARAYRLIEWSAQWLLGELGIDTARVAPERIPAHIALPPGRDGAFQAGLFAAWQLVGHHLADTPAGRFFAAEATHLRAHLEARNLSILAHGFEPIGRARWQEFDGWLSGAFLPMIEEERRKRRLAHPVPQLPLTGEGLFELPSPRA